MELGPHFSEGARLLWLLMERQGWTQSELRRRLCAHLGEVTRILYGDRFPRLAVAAEAERLGVHVAAWQQKPRLRFVPPAARRSRPRRKAA